MKSDLIIIVILIAVFSTAGFVIGQSIKSVPVTVTTSSSSSYTIVPAHTHPNLVLPVTAELPTATLEVSPDELGGYNLHIITTGVKFTPQKLGFDTLPGEGYFDVFVNSKEIGRAYSDWYYIDPEKLNTINDSKLTFEVRLVSNEQQTYYTSDNRFIGASFSIKR
jgi:hypothetical protein